VGTQFGRAFREHERSFALTIVDHSHGDGGPFKPVMGVRPALESYHVPLNASPQRLAEGKIMIVAHGCPVFVP
jgi:hypothetical protein